MTVGGLSSDRSTEARSSPEWFKNLRKAHQATLQIGRTVTVVTPHIVPEPERTQLYREVVAASSPAFAAYETKTDRVIPLALLRPIG